MKLFLIVFPILVLMVWVLVGPTTDPFRTRARTSSQLTEHEWCTLGAIHGVEKYHRDLDWDSQKAYFRRGLDRRLEELSIKQGWPKSRDRVAQFTKQGHRG